MNFLIKSFGSTVFISILYFLATVSASGSALKQSFTDYGKLSANFLTSAIILTKSDNFPLANLSKVGPIN